MRLAPIPQPAYLMRRQTFNMHTRKGQRIECRTGQLWITQDGDSRDVILGSDESFTLDRSGHTLVSALEDASFVLRTDVAPAQAGAGAY
jgi:hypothetical protein